MNPHRAAQHRSEGAEPAAQAAFGVSGQQVTCRLPQKCLRGLCLSVPAQVQVFFIDVNERYRAKFATSNCKQQPSQMFRTWSGHAGAYACHCLSHSHLQSQVGRPPA